MPLKDLLKKKEKLAEGTQHVSAPPPMPEEPVFTFLRSDTYTQEVITPPTFYSTDSSDNPFSKDGATEHESRTSRFFGRPRSVSAASGSSRGSDKSKTKSSTSKRLSERFGLKRNEGSSVNVPVDLPAITPVEEADVSGIESQWEARATILARKNEIQRSRPSTPTDPSHTHPREFEEKGVVSSKFVDDNIQEAIRLHEAGELETATQMFGRLADPKGENNALSQVLYGLALRHGWGCTPDPTKAVTYLSAAAANAASVEDLALKAGMKKGGAAKGELVLAVFELANCFRHGWGVPVDKFAAKQYYETAANLGDTDAMNEVAWCYVEGFGCKKDKYAAAKYYRLAEKAGSKTLGNTWIWKDKYNEPKK